MKLRTIAIVLSAGLVVGAGTVFGIRTYRHYHDKEDTRQPAPDEQHGPVGVGDQTFLWKPASDTRQGRAAVLVPAAITTAAYVTANGVRSIESVGATDNGNRHAFFMDRSGAAFGAPVRVIAYDGRGREIRAWTVPSGAQRWGAL